MILALRGGETCEIDDADAALVAGHDWRAWSPDKRTWYAVAGGGVERIVMHRLLMGDPPGQCVDHVNRNGLDNRRANLRLATRAENGRNAGPRGGSSRFKGVTLDRARGLWKAQIKTNRRGRVVGRFSTEEEAARAYDRAARELHGAFAYLNFPTDG